MRRLAIIENNKVVNIVVAEENFVIENSFDITNTPNTHIGDVLVDGAFVRNETQGTPEEILLAKRKKKKKFGQDLSDTIAVMNELKGMSHAQTDAFMENNAIKNLRLHLDAGNIDTFVNKLQNANVSAFFSDDEKANVLLKCNLFLAQLG